MSAHHDLFGLYRPGESPLHRAGVGAKYVLLLSLVAPAVLAQRPWVSATLLAATAGLLAVARVPARAAYRMPVALAVLLAALAAYHAVTGDWAGAFVVPGNVWLAVLASRLLVLTTPGPALVDALVAAVRPLRVVGVDPERVALAVALMIRSVPYLLGSMADVRMTARARGVERNPVALLVPWVVGAVGYAHATGEALAARGLAEGAPDRRQR